MCVFGNRHFWVSRVKIVQGIQFRCNNFWIINNCVFRATLVLLSMGYIFCTNILFYCNHFGFLVVYLGCFSLVCHSLSGALLSSANLASGTPIPRELHPGASVSAPPPGTTTTTTTSDAEPAEDAALRRNASEPAPATSARRRRHDKDKSKKEDRDRSRRRRREEG